MILRLEDIEPLHLCAELGETQIDLVHEFKCESCGNTFNPISDGI